MTITDNSNMYSNHLDLVPEISTAFIAAGKPFTFTPPGEFSFRYASIGHGALDEAITIRCGHAEVLFSIDIVKPEDGILCFLSERDIALEFCTLATSDKNFDYEINFAAGRVENLVDLEDVGDLGQVFYWLALKVNGLRNQAIQNVLVRTFKSEKEPDIYL
jgi:hypothetical protein